MTKQPAHPPAGDLEGFLSPQSVHLVGRLDRADRPLAKTAASLRAQGFNGPLTVDGPSVPGLLESLGIRPVTVDDPAAADLAVVAVRAELVPDAVNGLGGRVGRAIIYSSGFGEIGNRELDARLIDVATRRRVRLIGPNCQGIWNRNADFACTFSEYPRSAPRADGARVAVVSQSGAVAYCVAGLLDRSGVPAAIVASTGNEIDVDWAELAAAAAAQGGVDVVLAYLEQIRSIDQLERAHRGMQAAGARLTILKGGRTALGSHAAASHTAAVASDGVVLEQLCADLDIGFARDLPELAAAAALRRSPRGPARVAVISTSGGAGVIATDLISDAGRLLPTLSRPTRDALRARLGDNAGIANPVDVTAASAVDPTLIPTAWATIADSGEADVVLIVITMVAGERLEATADALASAVSARPQTARPLVILLSPPALQGDAPQRFQAAGIPVFDAIGPVAAALRAPQAGQPTVAGPPGAGAYHRTAETVAPVSSRVISDSVLLAEFAERGLPVVARAEFDFADIGTDRVAAVVPGPYVVKLVTGDIHKAAAGNVDVGPYQAGEVGNAARRLIGERFGAAPPPVQVQQYLHPALEVLVGCRREAVFGATLTVGLGGRLAEPVRAVRTWRLPVQTATIEHDLAECLVGQLAAQLGRSVVADLAAVAVSIGAFFLESTMLRELDVNPVLIGPDGRLTIIDAAAVADPA